MHNVAGNIAIVQDRETGRIHLPFTIGNIRLYHCYSDDLGETWSEPVELSHITSYWEHWVGFGPPSGLQTSSGRLLLPAYSSIMPIYDNGIFTRSFFVYSDDNGATWHRTSSNIPTNGLAVFNGDFGNEAEVVEVKPGLLLVNSRAAYGPRIQSTSTDDGLTWSAYSDTVIPQPVLGCEGSLLALGDGSTVLFSGPNTNDILRVDLGVWESGDEGESYELAWKVDFDLSATVGYSSMVRMNSGETKILWGRAMTVSEFFVPDYISIRSLPPSLWGEPRDTAGYVSPSGETQDMSWVSSKSSYKYSETFNFYALAASNFLLTGLQCVWGLWKVLTFLKGLCCRSPDDAAHLLDRGSSTHVNKSDLGLKAPSCLSRWCGCCCLPFLTFIFVVVSVVGTAAQWVFKMDDGERWQRQSLNVLVWNGAVVLLLVAAHVMRRGEKEEGGGCQGGENVPGRRQHCVVNKMKSVILPYACSPFPSSSRRINPLKHGFIAHFLPYLPNLFMQ